MKRGEKKEFDILWNLRDIYFRWVFARLIKICFHSSEKPEFRILISSLYVSEIIQTLAGDLTFHTGFHVYFSDFFELFY